MQTRLACCVLVLSVLGGTAAAADGPYGQIAGGDNHQHDQDLGTGGSVGFDEGGVGSASLGLQFMQRWRPEIEYAYRKNDADDSDGHERAEAAMVNLWYDFHPDWLGGKLHPYLGGGGGTANVEMQQVVDAVGNRRNADDDVAAWQGGAGLDYDATRHLVLSLGYRYFETDKGHFAGTPGTPANGLTPPTPGTPGVDARYRSDGVLAGLRYTFGGGHQRVASAEPVPVAQTAPPRTQPAPQEAEVAAFETVVLRPVNFQLNKAELTEPSKQTLDEIAARLASHEDLKALIEGYADSTGAASYNQQLGQRRAEAVRDYLASKGVNAANLQVSSRGEAEPVADNSTEEGRARNRRAQVYPEETPAKVKIVIEPPTEQSVEAAH